MLRKNNNKKNKMKKLISLTLIFVLLASTFMLASCTRASDDEALEIASDLIERSYNLNVAYYGEGLPCDGEENVAGNYYAVSKAAPFVTRNDLIVETKAVFSENIASSLISVYLDGTSSMGVLVYARYITGPDGYLTVYKDYDNVVENVTKYDTSTVEIVKNKRNEITARVYTASRTESIEVILVHELDGWRIDSPTY